MTLLAILFVITALVLVWVVGGREWLKNQSWSAGFFAWIEPYEIALWGKSETIFWSRFVPLMSAVSWFLNWLGALDVTPFIALFPEKFHPWLVASPFIAVGLLGVVSEIQRRATTKPLEIVAVPDDAPAVLVSALAEAEVAKDIAVAEIKAEAKETAAMENTPS